MAKEFKSPSGWFKRLLRLPIVLYRAGLGWLIGGRFMLLTTKGRKTGLPRTTPVEYFRMGDDLYVFAGRGKKAHWYKNLRANPIVVVQVGSKCFSARATPASEGEKLAIAEKFYSPAYELFLKNVMGVSWATPESRREAAKTLVSVRLEPIDDPPWFCVQADLVWIWPVLILVIALIALLIRYLPSR